MSDVHTPRSGQHRSLFRALVAACHPGPTVAVTLLSVVLGIAIGLTPLRVGEVALAVLAGQLAIGWSNDWLDARRDAEVGRLDKPVATGAVRVQTVRTAFIVVTLAVIPLSFVLGVAAGVAHLVLVASGLSYNLGLKKTALSWLPYVVSFGLLPLVVTLASTPPQRAAWWVMGAGALLGLAAHFANVLPDLDDDRATGVRGLPHRLGRTPSGLAAFGSLLVASALVTFGAGRSLGDVGVVGLVGFALEVMIAGVGVWLVLTRPPGRLLFQLIIASALLAVVQLALSGSSLMA
ncbi:UbiA family prenyltransferase [Subtercola lobariae]|uniref:Membrane protein n=1 Tax=Subtercola lobariae TaxID=1588641 RepID=A0A917F369_9MICO|nr:UbiA family prenyltransferase [Subtercola lobariae]GGF40428.1 membrane protein [Subtercola lobariae]